MFNININKISIILLFVALVVLPSTLVFAAKIDLKEYNRLRGVESVLLNHIQEMEKELKASASFNKYKNEFLNSIPKTSPVEVSESSIAKMLSIAPYVFMGDEHTTLQSQVNTCKVLRLMRNAKQPLTIVVEWIDLSFQNDVNSFLAGKTSLTNLKKKINYQKLWGFPWSGYSNILKTAKSLKVKVLLAERLKKSHSLNDRDSFIVNKIVEDKKTNPNMRYLVVYGDYHIYGPSHLSEKAAKAGLKPQAIFIGDSPKTYWQLLKKNMDSDKVGIAKLKQGVYYIPNGTPLERNLSYRDYLLNITGYDESDFDVWATKLDIVPKASVKKSFQELHRN